MNFLLDYMRQKAPKSNAEMPAYYRTALTSCYQVLAVYFPLSFILFAWLVPTWEWMPVAMLAATVIAFLGIKRLTIGANLIVKAGITLVWSAWYVQTFGWGCGIQLFLFPLMLLVFFNIYGSPRIKVGLFLGLVAYRMLLFTWSQSHAPTFELSRTANIVLQSVNSVTAFIAMALLCILFSTNTQATERQLRIVNQNLHKEAGTDPLTQLPNRRALLDEINSFLQNMPTQPFSVAIADIDFFKSVNDTYGHNCGDYTLKTLADLFREHAEAGYQVCRWGGEEFCFFLPDKNLDQAADVMNTICSAVRHMPLSFEGNDFKITITIGVAENDFRSSMDVILGEADRKLYLGKNSGRNQVIV